MEKTKQLDYDARRDPKTERYCICCQKDIRPKSKARQVLLNSDKMEVLHPRFHEEGHEGQWSWWLLGMDCAKRLGMEWSVPE